MIDPQRNKEEAEPLARIKNNIAAHSDVFLIITHRTDMGSFFVPSVFFVCRLAARSDGIMYKNDILVP